MYLKHSKIQDFDKHFSHSMYIVFWIIAIFGFLQQKYWNETYGAGILQRSSGTNISTKNSSFVVFLFPIFKQMLAMVQGKYWHSDLKQQTWKVVIFTIIVRLSSPAFEKFKLYFGSIFCNQMKIKLTKKMLWITSV